GRGGRPGQVPLRVAVPAGRQRRGAEGLVERLVERLFVRIDGRGRVLHDAAPVELDEELAEAIGEDRDLRLLEADADDAAAVAGLQEARPIARLAHGSGGPSVRAV